MFIFGLLFAATMATEIPVPLEKIGSTFNVEPGVTNLWTLTGQITGTSTNDLFICDSSGSAWIEFPEEFLTDTFPSLSIGDHVRIRCLATHKLHEYRNLKLTGDSIEVLGHGELPPPKRITLQELNSGRYDCHQVRVRGVVADVFRDEIDPRYIYFLLQDEDSRTLLFLKDDRLEISELSRRYTDGAVEITGLCIPCTTQRRQYEDRGIAINDLAAIRELAPGDSGTFRFARRRELRGKVLATWGTGSMFVDAGGDSAYRVRLAVNEKVPAPGDLVTLSGFYHKYTCFKSCDNAIVTDIRKRSEPLTVPAAVSPRTILCDPHGRPRIKIVDDGRILTLEGRVSSISYPGTERSSFTIESDGELVTVITGGRQLPDIGALVAVTGACLIQNDADDHGFIHLNGFALITRDDGDIAVLRAAPWWTPGRLLAAIFLLLAALAVIIVWNRILQRMVERRGRQLLKSEIAKVGETLRLDERTRLAIELHDSISQNLTGVVFRLDTALDTRESDPEASIRNLRIAAQMLHSCRVELRRCIWDLKSNALENPDLGDAIRGTVAPLLSGCTLRVRFNVPRSRLSDTTTHAVLRIIRELTANAIAHGKARNVRIAGEISTGQLNISVSDDGTGFDPETAPGPLEGHFGIMGIRERIKRFKGTVTVTSAPGRGTRIRITIPAPQLENPS